MPTGIYKRKLRGKFVKCSTCGKIFYRMPSLIKKVNFCSKKCGILYYTTRRKIKSNSYDSIHYWLRSRFGKANKCENPNCLNNSNFFQYALIKGKQHKRNRENYMMLCVSCHYRLDDTKEKHIKIGNALRGRKHSLESSIKKSLATKGKINIGNKYAAKPIICVETEEIYESITDAAKTIKKCNTTIHDALNKENGTAGGFKW